MNPEMWPDVYIFIDLCDLQTKPLVCQKDLIH